MSLYHENKKPSSVCQASEMLMSHVQQLYWCEHLGELQQSHKQQSFHVWVICFCADTRICLGCFLVFFAVFVVVGENAEWKKVMGTCCKCASAIRNTPCGFRVFQNLSICLRKPFTITSPLFSKISTKLKSLPGIKENEIQSNLRFIQVNG